MKERGWIGRIGLVSLVVVVGIVSKPRTTYGSGVNLSAIGAEHAHSNGVAVASRASAFAPNAPGNAVFAGTTGLAASHCGTAFGAGSGQAARIGGVVNLRARARAALAAPVPFPAGCVLHAWGLGHADPTPDPSTNPYDDASLMGIFGETGAIPDVPSATESDFEALMSANPVGGGASGADADLVLNVSFDDPNDRLLFQFDGNSALSIESNSLDTFSASIALDSEILGIHRSWAYDETGFRDDLSRFWNSASLMVVGSGTSLTISGFSNLNFSVSVGPDFTEADFDNVDLVLQGIGTASVPEPSALAFFGLMGLAALFRRAGGRSR